MTVDCRIFYSWQSNLPNSTNRAFIQEALESAVVELKADATITVEPVIDRDTAGVAGSPDIGITIFGKIDATTVFVSDVSIVTPEDDHGRPAPNPNVLVELGYALKSLSYARTVMVMNTTFGGPEKLPFDLKQKRVVTYELAKGADKAAARKLLCGKLAAALKDIIKEHQSSLRSRRSDAPSVAVQLRCKDRQIDGPRHVYGLEMTLTNTSTVTIPQIEWELEFPRAFVPPSRQFHAHEERSDQATKTHRSFRGGQELDLRPNKTATVWMFEYHVTEDLHEKYEGQMKDLPVTVEVFADGRSIGTDSVAFERLQHF